MKRAAAVALLLARTLMAEPSASPPPAGTTAPQSPSVSAPTPAAKPFSAVFPLHLDAGVDPRMASLVAEQLEKSAARIGYAAVDPSAVRAVAARSGARGALGAGEASTLVRSVGAHVGLFASVSAEAGRYRVNVQVVRADGAPPVSAQATGVSRDLWAALDRAVVSVLPAPAALGRPVPVGPRGAAPSSEPMEIEEPMPEGRFRLAAATQAAFGVYNGEFRNHLAGLRADRRFSDQVALGVGLFYANLKGKQGRAHNVLPFAQFEYRIDLGAGYAVPLRYASGYLPKNGPVVHGAAGLAVPLGDELDLGLELVAPTVWIVQERAVLSLDAAVELALTL